MFTRGPVKGDTEQVGVEAGGGGGVTGYLSEGRGCENVPAGINFSICLTTRFHIGEGGAVQSPEGCTGLTFV